MKNKHIFGGIIVTVFLGLMIYLFTQSNLKYEDDISKVIEKGKSVKLTGFWVKEKNYEIDKVANTFTFFIKDTLGHEMKVVYSGMKPDNFENSHKVVITGQYKNGAFQARDILTKCPSKYQDQKAAANS